jgi:Rrf2 family iron-sulfur cluster assembly transcriptional regulator
MAANRHLVDPTIFLHILLTCQGNGMLRQWAMKLSTRSRYGIRILVELAHYAPDQPIQVSTISKQQGISVKYLELLIRTLKKAGLIASVRGAKGGHMLAAAPDTITLGQIVRLFEGQTDLVACVSSPERCSRIDHCKVHDIWVEATHALFDKLDSITIADLVETETAESC